MFISEVPLRTEAPFYNPDNPILHVTYVGFDILIDFVSKRGDELFIFSIGLDE